MWVMLRLAVVAAIAGSGSAMAQAPVAAPQRLDPWAAAMLDAHNRVRDELRLPHFTYSYALQQGAAAYAARLAQIRQLVHSPRAGRGTARENLLKISAGANPYQMVAVWHAEKRFFRAGPFPNITRTANWQDVGHYSQMIWPTTTMVGCASARSYGEDWVVCRYDPGGNKDGKWVGRAPSERG